MKKFQLTVHQYRNKLEKEFGYADEEMVKRYAAARADSKRKDFNPFTNDPNCKQCKKKRKG